MKKPPKLVSTLLHFLQDLWNALHDPELEGLLVLVIAVLLVGTVTYHFLEGWGWIDSIYFCVVTLTTIGYGDLHPTTALTKIFTMIYILIGVGLILAFISKASGKALDSHREHGDDGHNGHAK